LVWTIEVLVGIAYKFLLLTVQVYTWGKGYCGALGHGDEIEKTRPELLSSLKNNLAVQVLYP
jgi:alpha-tubulin suppressor-like RCC1 family protein